MTAEEMRDDWNWGANTDAEGYAGHLANTWIMRGAARLTAEPASRSCSSLTDRPILR